jgi:amino acid adenylation domain-containing protein
MSSPVEQAGALSPKQKQLLQQRLREKGLQVKGEPQIPRRAGAVDCPLSFAQERLWFLAQLEPDNPFYNIPLALRLQGPLDLTALTAALNSLLARHEALRTGFVLAGGRPLQHINPIVSFTPAVSDLRQYVAAEREALVQEWLHRETRAPFDLTQAPLLRLRLLQLAEQDYVALFTLHHIIADGWSLGVLVRELAAYYAAARIGLATQALPLPVQYPDYALWQRQWLTAEVLQEQLSYWQQRLHEAPPYLSLPTDRPRPGRPTHRGNRQTLRLPAALLTGLRQLSRGEGATLFMTLLTAFQVLLARYTGQRDIVVGTPVAGRRRTELEGLIGFFVNTLVLRVEVAGGLTFRQLLGRVREAMLEALAHQDVPLEKIVEVLRPERQGTHQPLFNVLFTYQNESVSLPRLDGLTVSVLETDSPVAKFDLSLSMVEEAEGLTASLAYDTDLFDDTTVTRLLNHWQTLLEAIVLNPDQRSAALPLLTPAERRQLLVEWNDTAAAYPAQSLHQLFESQAGRTPHAIAVRLEDKTLTYEELNRQANQLARHLQSLGVGPEICVAVCLDRSIEMIVALVATLKAGGAYVPIEPAYPRDRISYILRDTGAPALITRSDLLDSLPRPKTNIVCLDKDFSSLRPQQVENPDRLVSAHNLAYIIYTSGSTGQPKGVMITHQAICNRLLWGQTIYQLSAADRVLQGAAFSFDFSVWEIFGTLLAGAEMVLIRSDCHQDVAYLIDLIARRRVTVAHFVPSLLQALLAGPEVERCSSLRLVFAGGEALTGDMPTRFFARLTAELYNQYGPTEAAVDATWWVCRRDQANHNVPIGQPIANTQIYILDGRLQPTPVGVAGELHIGGVGLARGYLNRPDLTAASFVPCPFSPEAGARLYKTGDRARYRPDGSIEFLGRIDQQVKLRGFRLELGEIEAALNHQPNICASAAAVWPDEAGGQRLVAYLVPEQEPKPTVEELRRFLQERLPDYMLPAAFVWLDELPLLDSGKLDRQRLPDPAGVTSPPETAPLPPRTLVEELLAGIWGQVLGLKHLGIQHNFFHLGGHSLLATQIISRVREVFRAEIPLHDLFEAPTVASFGRRVEEALHLKHGVQPRPIERAARQADMPLSYAQQRLWFIDQLQPNSPVYNIPAAVRLQGRLNRAAFEQALDELVRRHEVLRTTFAMVNGQPVQRIAAGQPIALPLVDLSSLTETDRAAEAQRLAEEEAFEPFSLAQGPLLRAKLLRMAENDYVGLLTIHHIVSDGWSMNLLIHELTTLYEAFIRHAPSPLPELPIQYADFAVWQRQWLQGELLDKLLDYWRRQLGGNLPALNLPLDRPRPPVQSQRGLTLPVGLSRELSAGLNELSRCEGVTLFMTLLAAFQTLFHRLTGQNDIVVGSDIANRTRAETEALLGFFVNQLVLRADLSGNPSFRELLWRAREVALGAYAHQDLPFDLLVQALQPERNLSYSPLFQVKLILNNMPATTFELPELTIEALPVASKLAHFDLVLSLTETADGLIGWWQFNSDLFNEATVIRMRGSFQTLLESIVANPDERLSDLRLLTERETGGRVAADFPKARLNQKDFENLILEIGDVV